MIRHTAPAVLAALAAALFPLAPARAEPANPSDEQITAADRDRAQRAAAVGRLAAAVALKHDEMHQLSVAAERAVERYNKARDDLAAAAAAAQRSRVEAQAAHQRVVAAREDMARFARGSYRQGSILGSMTALLDDGGPTELVQRLDYLTFTSRHRLDVVGQLERAMVARANADSRARAALTARQAATDRAAAARSAAAQKVAAARAQYATLRREAAAMRQQLERAQVALSGLQEQRRRHAEWQSQREQAARRHAEQVAAVQEAARQAARQAAGDASRESVREAGSTAVRPRPQAAAREPAGGWSAAKGQAAADAALRWLGTSYAWAGGDERGPTEGSYPDEGVVGFDCSGLALYAWGQVGVSLPHYSGYQYDSGRHVSTEELLPGDLVFWSDDGTPEGIHHVAIWIGNGQVVQAPESGDRVKVSDMWYDGYVGATRPGT